MKVYGSDTVAVPAAARAARFFVPISVAPVPLASAAFWKRFVKPSPVEAFAFEMVTEKVFATLVVAEVGDTEPAVRSGRAATLAELSQENVLSILRK